MTSAAVPVVNHPNRRKKQVSDILSNVSADVVLAELTNQIATLSRENAILKAMTQKLRQQLAIQDQELQALREKNS